MKNEKVIQIMAAPENMYAIYENEEDKNKPMESKIVCLGLTNLGEVILMDADDSGYIADVSEVSNFKGIEWKKGGKK